VLQKKGDFSLSMARKNPKQYADQRTQALSKGIEAMMVQIAQTEGGIA